MSADSADKPWDDKERAAYHEAGHAVLYCEFGHTIEDATIEPVQGEEGKWKGHVSCTSIKQEYLGQPWDVRAGQGPDPTKEQHVLIRLAGFAVDRIRKEEWGLLQDGIVDNADWSRARCDWSRARDICETSFGWQHPGGPLVWAYLNWMLARTQWLLSTPRLWNRVEAIAGELVHRERLRGDEVRTVIAEVLPE